MRNRDQLVELLREAATRGATEIHLKAPQRPLLRIGQSLVRTDRPALSANDTQAAAYALCALANASVPLAEVLDHEFAFGLDRIGRFNVYLYRQRGSLALLVRPVGGDTPTLEALGADLDADEFLLEPGLTLLAGPGRDRMRAALVDHYNRRHVGHIAVVEERLRYLHNDDRAIVTQREVGSDVADLASGIAQSSRMGMDALLVGDLHDPATVLAALDQAERALPVIASVGAPTPTDAVWWITRQFFGGERQVVERRLQRMLASVIGCCPVQVIRRPMGSNNAADAPMPSFRARKALQTG